MKRHNISIQTLIKRICTIHFLIEASKVLIDAAITRLLPKPKQMLYDEHGHLIKITKYGY